ncbi:hypothetical protein CK222_03430 [Mesorhizobium sp. WSM3866]|uniref:hypothetical protein n=1 Tax=Mesorhizobium sp. WSM3866 TaxID=422271 RepID=UPI000BAF08A9|nr:hypothetical protein [Mesorhizobium sp. WSM3866]PBB45540.1 hypothetical protein CK222_03430 [Mesorhizobium sp. WSM3866]
MTTVTRTTLHDLVWTKSMEEVSAHLGASAGKISAICRENDIPVPPPHYWRMVANGSPPKRRTLPIGKFRRNQLVQIGDQVEPAFNQEWPSVEEVTDDKPIHAAAPVEVTDPLAIKIQKDLRRSLVAGDVHLRSGLICVDISRDSVPRAANLITSLKAAVAQRSWSVAADTKAGVVVDGEKVELQLSEGYALTPHTPTATEIRDHRSYGRAIPEHDRVRSGHLQLSITNATYLGIRQKWADGKRQRVEDVLAGFLDGIERAAAALKQQRVELEERDRRWAEESRRREEQQRLEAIDRVRGAVFRQQASDHQEARHLQAYIAAVKDRLLPGSEHEAAIQEWITWAEGYVSRLDPLSQGLPILLSEEDALRLRWQYPER